MKYEYTGRIRFSETGEDRRLTVPGIVNYLQDTCTFQSEDLGVGLDELRKHDLAWVITYWHIDILERPLLGQQVTTATWAYDFKSFFGLRNFDMKDESGKVLVRSNSVWLLLNMKTMLPARVPEMMTERYGLSEKAEMDYLPRKLKLPEHAQAGQPFAIETHHLDVNHHVNNEQYIAMAMSYLPEGAQVKRLRAEYRHQAVLGDIVVPAAAYEDGCVTVSLQDEQGQPYAMIEMVTEENGKC